MAKDGTLRGTRATGRPKKAIIEKLESGNPGHRPIQILDVPKNLDTVELEGSDILP